jgi:hypothetical protein
MDDTRIILAACLLCFNLYLWPLTSNRPLLFLKCEDIPVKSVRYPIIKPVNSYCGGTTCAMRQDHPEASLVVVAVCNLMDLPSTWWSTTT